MREIKFRGKDCIGEWWYGNLEIRRKVTDEKTYESIRISGIVTDNFTSMIDAKTVGQFTGLHDKNGKEIYEGDIVCSLTSVGDIQFDYGVFGIEWTHNKETKSMKGAWGQKHNLRKMDDGFTNDIEIIGNIHDNKELLNRK